MAKLTKEELLDPKPRLSAEMKELIGRSQLTSAQYRELISEMIRLDIPILEIGSSSIGKSYSIREMLDASGIKGEFLFVGTEKAEFIEGIPNLKAVSRRTDEIKSEEGAVKAQVKEEVGEKFSYLKPYWFPSKVEIGNRLVNGRRQLELEVPEELQQMWRYVKTQDVEIYKGQNSFGVLETLKFRLLDFMKGAEEIKQEKAEERKTGKKQDFSSRYVYADAMMYISMLQGYGNFWLILDEIDKVSEQDKDKYAPLLHIVRERELKGWKLSGIRSYPEYDPKFVSDITLRIKNLDKALDLFAAGNDIDLTDTRIIAIANDLRTLEKSSPALYRRFVKMIIDKTLYEETAPAQADPKMQAMDPAKFYNNIRMIFNNCVVSKEVPKSISGGKAQKVSIAEDMASIDPRLVGNPLDELNLQWTLGFLPEILFPGAYFDATSRDNLNMIPNKIIENFNKEQNPYAMYFYKIAADNFVWYYVKPLIVCANEQIGKKKELVVDKGLQSVIDADELLAEIKDYDNPDPKVVLEKVINRYKNQLAITEERFRDIVEQQQGKKKVKGSAQVMETVFNTGKQKIRTGVHIIAKSIKNKKPTKLTGLLMSSIPFIQQQFLCHSPFISLETARQYQKDIDEGMENMVFGSMVDDTDSPEAMDSAAGSISPDKDLVNMFGYGFDSPELVKEIEALKPGVAFEENKQIILDRVIKNQPIMMYDRLWSKLSPDQKKEYQQSTASFMIAEKEVLQNLKDTLQFHVEVIAEIDATEARVTESIDNMISYARRFPFSVEKFMGEVYPIDKTGVRPYPGDQIDKVIGMNIGEKTYSPLDVIHE